VVEVTTINCEDCKHLVENVWVGIKSAETGKIINVEFFSTYCALKFMPVLDDGFTVGCSNGEPKEEASER